MYSSGQDDFFYLLLCWSFSISGSWLRVCNLVFDGYHNFSAEKTFRGLATNPNKMFLTKSAMTELKKKCPLINLDSASVSNKDECSTFPQSLRASVKLQSSIHEARRMYSPKPVAHLWGWLMKTSFWWEFVPIGEKKMVNKTLVNEGKAMIKIDFTITLLLNSK